jgi:hypothetical protein
VAGRSWTGCSAEMAGKIIAAGFGGGGGPAACSTCRTLALLTSFLGAKLGAKLGASVGRRRATSGHIEPGLPQVNGSHADARPHPAIAGACMACKRSGVRIP